MQTIYFIEPNCNAKIPPIGTLRCQWFCLPTNIIHSFICIRVTRRWIFILFDVALSIPNIIKYMLNWIFSENIQSSNELSLCVVIIIAKYSFWKNIKSIQVAHNLVVNAVFREYHLCVFHIDDDCIQDNFSWQVSWKLLASKIFWQPHAVCHNIVYL